MALHTPTQGVPSPILPADTFADIPFDPVTGNFVASGTFGQYLAGQYFFTIDDGNLYMVVPDGSGGLTLTTTRGALIFGTIGTSSPALPVIPKGFMVTQDTFGGTPQLYVTAAQGLATQGITLRDGAIGVKVPILLEGIALAVVTNGVTVLPGQGMTAANGKAQLAGATTVGISVDVASRTGNAGGTVLVRTLIHPAGN